MKILSVMILASLLIVVGNAAAANIEGTWTGTMYCSDREPGDTGETFTVEITQQGDFFTTYNPANPDETCGGVIDGNKISMTCRVFSSVPEVLDSSVTFAYGEIKGKVIYIINHKPGEPATCKGTVALVTDGE